MEKVWRRCVESVEMMWKRYGESMEALVRIYMSETLCFGLHGNWVEWELGWMGVGLNEP